MAYGDRPYAAFGNSSSDDQQMLEYVKAGGGARLSLDIDPDQIRYIPANVGAQINATTVLGAKYVDLIYPDNPTAKRLSSGQVLQSRNVATEVNTVFQDLVDVLHQIDPEKINAVLAAVAEGVRGQGERIGQATTAATQVLAAYNDRMDTLGRDWRSFKAFNDAYKRHVYTETVRLNNVSMRREVPPP